MCSIILRFGEFLKNIRRIKSRIIIQNPATVKVFDRLFSISLMRESRVQPLHGADLHTIDPDFEMEMRTGHTPRGTDLPD